MRVALLALLLVGCASGRLTPDSPAWSAWNQALDGSGDRGEEAFTRALAAAPDDPLALFGRATLAFERGDLGAALEGHLRLLERSVADPPARGLAAAAAARLAVLLD